MKISVYYSIVDNIQCYRVNLFLLLLSGYFHIYAMKSQTRTSLQIKVTECFDKNKSEESKSNNEYTKYFTYNAWK